MDVLLRRGFLSSRQAEAVAAAIGEKGYRRLGDFEILRKLGEGGMGAVYKARQLSTGRVVALKVLPRYLARERVVLRRFRREARVCARLQHPNIVRGLAVGEAEGRHYFAMEYVEGRTLRELVEQQGPLPPRRALPIFKQIAAGLAYAHAHGLVHRDIKPDNIILTRDGVAKLADLGLVREVHFDRTAITQSGITLGTAYYMPPEQARSARRADARSDIYALGATFYHLLTGRVPFQGDSAFEVLSKHQTAPLVPPRQVNPRVPKGLSSVIERMMRKRPEDRFQSMDEVLAALEEVELSPGGGGEGRRPRDETPAERHRPATEQLWYVWLGGPKGEPKIEQFRLADLEEAIVQGRLPLDAPVRCGSAGQFMLMARHPRLRRALRRRRAQDRFIARRRGRTRPRPPLPRALRLSLLGLAAVVVVLLFIILLR